MNEEGPRTILQSIQSLLGFVRTQIRWFSRVLISLVVAFAVLHAFSLPIAEQISPTLGFEKPSLMAIIAVSILVFILERIVIIEDKVTRGPASPLRTYLTRDVAYSALANQLSSRKAAKVDLLQFSGDTARELLRAVARNSPRAEVRLLLFDPNAADQFDTDSEEHHVQRIKWTVNFIRVLEEDFAKDDFRVSIRHYTAMPSVAAVVVDHYIVSVSWYRTFLEGNVMRLRGHSSATITGSGESAAPLLSFAETQFDALWNSAEEA